MVSNSIIHQHLLQDDACAANNWPNLKTVLNEVWLLDESHHTWQALLLLDLNIPTLIDRIEFQQCLAQAQTNTHYLKRLALALEINNVFQQDIITNECSTRLQLYLKIYTSALNHWILTHNDITFLACDTDISLAHNISLTQELDEVYLLNQLRELVHNEFEYDFNFIHIIERQWHDFLAQNICASAAGMITFSQNTKEHGHEFMKTIETLKASVNQEQFVAQQVQQTRIELESLHNDYLQKLQPLIESIPMASFLTDMLQITWKHVCVWHQLNENQKGCIGSTPWSLVELIVDYTQLMSNKSTLTPNQYESANRLFDTIRHIFQGYTDLYSSPQFDSDTNNSSDININNNNENDHCRFIETLKKYHLVQLDQMQPASNESKNYKFTQQPPLTLAINSDPTQPLKQARVSQTIIISNVSCFEGQHWLFSVENTCVPMILLVIHISGNLVFTDAAGVPMLDMTQAECADAISHHRLIPRTLKSLNWQASNMNLLDELEVSQACNGQSRGL